MKQEDVIVKARITMLDMVEHADMAELIEQRCGMRLDHLPETIGLTAEDDYDGLVRTYTFFHKHGR